MVSIQEQFVIKSGLSQLDFYVGQPKTKYLSNFHLFFQVLCIYQQPNLLASHQEVSGLKTGLKSDIFSNKIFEIVQFFSHFCSCAFSSISANLAFIPINFISLKVPPVQFSSPWSLEVTYTPQIQQLLCVKNGRAIVVCGFLMK